MTREQDRILAQLDKYFLINDEITLDRAKFEFILDAMRARKDSLYPPQKESYAHYRQYGYTYKSGKIIKCK